MCPKNYIGFTEHYMFFLDCKGENVNKYYNRARSCISASTSSRACPYLSRDN